jgi:hypothetical protein
MAVSHFSPVAVFAAVALATVATGAGGAQRSMAMHTTASSDSLPTIYVNYTDQCTFAIVNDAGQPLMRIPPGTYQVNVNTPTLFRQLNSQSDAPTGDTGCKGFVQFQMTGPGVNLATTLDLGCEATITLPATYFAPDSTFVALDNNNPSATRTTLITAADSPPMPPPDDLTPAPPTGVSPIGGRRLSPLHHLGGILSANGTVTLLTSAGRHALTVPQGDAVITVEDRDAQATFVIQQNGSSPIRLTPARFVGEKVKEVLFTPGIWKYYALPHDTMHTFLVVG